MEFQHSVFIAYWGTEHAHGSYARAKAIKRDIEESLPCPLPYVNSNHNNTLFTEHKDKTIQEAKLFLLVLNHDCPANASGQIDNVRCAALCEEIETFLDLIKSKRRFAKDFAIYFESNAIEQTAQFAYLQRLLSNLDPEGILHQGNSNFHLKSTKQILNWIEERWECEGMDANKKQTQHLLEAINGLLAEIDSNTAILPAFLKKVTECDKLVKALPPATQNKISLSWNGIIMMLNMLNSFPQGIQEAQFFAILSPIKFHLQKISLDLLS